MVCVCHVAVPQELAFGLGMGRTDGGKPVVWGWDERIGEEPMIWGWDERTGEKSMVFGWDERNPQPCRHPKH